MISVLGLAGLVGQPLVYESIRTLSERGVQDDYQIATTAPLQVTGIDPSGASIVAIQGGAAVLRGGKLTIGLYLPNDTTKFLRGDGAWTTPGGTGTVTSIAAGTGITFTPGTPITTTGTIGLTIPVVPSSGGTGTTTVFTPGSIVFAGASGVYAQDNANLFYDAATQRLGVGGAPSYKLHVQTSTANDQAVRGVNTATSGTNYGVVGVCSGASTQNIGLFGFATGAATNMGLQITKPDAGTSNWSIYSSSTAQSYFSGRVGFGTTTPVAQAEVKHPGTAGTSVGPFGPVSWTRGSTNVHDAGGGFSTSWLGAQIIDTTTTGQPSYVIEAVTATDITLNVAYGGTTGNKNYSIWQRTNAQVISNFGNTLSNGLYMKLGSGNAVQGIYIDSTIGAGNTGAAINIATFNAGDAMHIAVECPGTGTPTPYGLGIDMNRANYPTFAGTGVGVLNFSDGSGSNLGYGFSYACVAGGLSPGFVAACDANALWMSPASASYPADAVLILMRSGTAMTGSDLFKVYGTGMVTSTQPRANATNSAAQSITNATQTALTFNTNNYDNGVHSTSSNTSRFTVPTNGDGWYCFIGQLTFNTLAGGTQRFVTLWKNGSTQIATSGFAAANGGAPTYMNVSWQGQLAAGDYIEMYAYQDSGAAANTVAGNANTWGSLCKVC